MNRSGSYHMIGFFLKILGGFLIGSFSIVSALSQERYRFESLSVEEGLSQTSVLSIYQDSLGFMWFGTEDGLNRYDGYAFKTFRHLDGDSTNQHTDKIFCMLEYPSAVLWVGTKDKGLNQFDMKRGIFRNVPLDSGKQNMEIKSLAIDSLHRIWVATNKGLYHIEEESEKFVQVNSFDVRSMLISPRGNVWMSLKSKELKVYNPSSAQYIPDRLLDARIRDQKVNHLTSDTYGRICLSCEAGVYTYDEISDSLSRVVMNINADRSLIASSEQVWVGETVQGLHIIQPSSDHIHMNVNPCNPESIAGNIIRSLYEDRSGIIWIGTYNGLSVFNPQANRFQKYFHHLCGSQTLQNPKIRAVFQDTEGIFWIGNAAGLHMYHRDEGTLYNMSDTPKDPGSKGVIGVWSIWQDANKHLWIGTSKGVHLFDKKKKKFDTSFSRSSVFHHIKNHGSIVMSFCEDQRNRLWIGTQKGLFVIGLTSKQLIAEALNLAIRTIVMDSIGNMWIGTEGSGLLKAWMNEENQIEIMTPFSQWTKHPENAQKPFVTSILLQDEIIWYGTYGGGLVRLDPINQDLQIYQEKDDPARNVVYAIVPDDHENLWISTNGGVFCFNTKQAKFTRYDVHDGLQSNEFNAGVWFKDKKGEIFFGGVNGMNGFNPDQFQSNAMVPSIVFTDFQIGINNSSDPKGKSTFYSNPFEQRLSLPNHKKYLSVEFSALTFTRSYENQYAYKLEGYDSEWQYLKNRRSITFGNLQPGTYRLTIIGAGPQGDWESRKNWNTQGASIDILILPPWYQTWWAIGLWIVIGILMLVGIVWIILTFIRAQDKVLQLQEQDRIYTQVTHEFRTPLTIVLSTVEELLEKSQLTPNQSLLEGIQRNAKHIAQLVDHLMHLARAQANKLSLELALGDIVGFIKESVESFLPIVEEEGKQLSFSTKVKRFDTCFDPLKIRIILFNLVSNAIKFTPPAGQIAVSFEKKESEYYLYVEDTGPGIPIEEREKVFERFYQIQHSSSYHNAGIGIGLHLVQELIRLHAGAIQIVDGVNGKGTKIVCKFPIISIGQKEQLEKRSKPMSHEDPALYLASPPFSHKDRGHPANSEGQIKLLLVEDKVEMRDTFSRSLPEEFMVIEALDGKEGLEKALHEIPDIIISDIMMPKIDGITFTEKIRQHKFTSHIPIILLTAKKEDLYRYKGISAGADAYISKPYTKMELLITIQMLLEVRKKIQRHYWIHLNKESTGDHDLSLDQKFQREFIQLVENRYHDSGLTAQVLCNEMNCSGRQLNRKVQALFGSSPKKYLLYVRMHKAADLLKNKTDHVKQIAYQVGFSDPAYFSKCFKEVFGVPPSDY